MKGTIYKRCSGCGRTSKQRSCAKCGSTRTSWYYRARVGRGADGRWIEEKRGGYATRREAEHALTEVLAAVNGGAFVTRHALTVREYLLDEWLVATAPPRVRPDTWEDRRSNLALHVVPRIGDVPLQELAAPHLNQLYNELLASGRIDKAGGLSPTSVRRIHAILRKALNDAVRWGRVGSNVTERADPPPARLAASARRRAMRTWSADEVRTFLDTTTGEPLHPLWLLAATTGLRRSELLGLAWADIDVPGSTLSVRNTVVRSGDGQYELVQQQKTTVSARTIHLDPMTLDALERQRSVVASLRADVGPLWEDRGLVFPKHDGLWINPPAVTAAFRRAVLRAGVTLIRFHDLRHSHATLLLRAGVNPKVVSERLGHSSVAFTLDTYAHVMPGMQRDAASQFVEMVFAQPTVQTSPGEESP